VDRELSARALAVGLVLGIPLAAANVYAGLKLGVVDAGGTTIILAAFALFGAGRRRFSPRETVVSQVSGSSAASMALTAGLVGPIPALAMSARTVAPAAIVLWGCALAVLGTLLAVPFRRTFLEAKKLPFPSARAAGEVIVKLFADGSGGRRAVWVLAASAAGAAAVTVARDQLHWLPGQWLAPLAVSGVPAAALLIGLSASPLVVGVGVLVGARVGLSMLLGAGLAWLVAAPALVARGVAAAGYEHLVTWTLWPGAALMVAASLTSLLLGAGDLVRAWRAAPAAGPTAAPWVRPALIASALAVVAVGWLAFAVHPLHALFAVALGAAFSIAGMQATGETDNTPSGPLGGLTQGLVGLSAPGEVGTPLHAGGVVNGAVTHSSQMLAAWKTGELVGSAPRRLLVAQLAGVATGALAAVVGYWLVQEAYGIGTEAMPSPAALTWKATADAVAHGTEGMPPGAPLAALVGAAAGVLLTLGERRERLRRLLPSAVAIGIGFILPAMISTTLALSAIAFALVARRAPAWHERSAPSLASGLILGEGFAGVIIAAIAIVSAS
jgi:uncharacterized oligopeptide transporter (OPT) family protein